MAVVQHLEGVAVEVDVTIEVHLVEGLHGDLVPAIVLGLVRRLLEGEIVLDRAAGEPGLLVLAGRDARGSEPEGGKQGKGGEEGDEDGCLQTAAYLP
jgi:hypothetical protein